MNACRRFTRRQNRFRPLSSGPCLLGQVPPEGAFSPLNEQLAGPIRSIVELCAAIQGGEPLGASIIADLGKIEAAAGRLRGMLENPAEIGASAAPAMGAARASTHTESRRENPGGRLLVVDDNDASRDLLCRRLEREGYSVSSADGGRKALDMIASEAFDLALLDVMMPDVDGFQMLHELKENGLLARLPVIMTSAMDEVASAVRCIELGAEDYLTKPFDPVLLRARIRASLEKKHMRDEDRMSAQRLREALCEIEEQKRLLDAFASAREEVAP